MSWNLDDEVGTETLEHMITRFYDLLFDDLFVGFLFQPHNKDALIASQLSWLRANLGDRSGTYEGKPIRAAHSKLPILVGHFDRRHQILKDVIAEFDIPEQVAAEWLELDQKLRPLVVRTGHTAREEILSQSEE